MINHRGTEETLRLVENITRSFGSRFVYLSYEEHDLVTANTQAVTHAAFLRQVKVHPVAYYTKIYFRNNSMGTAWASSSSYPWEQGLYVGGMETVKVNLTLRIYSNAWHVYAGLAILNPKAREQIDQYAKSTTELFKLMLEAGTAKKGSENHDGEQQDSEQKLRKRVEWARDVVFGPNQTRKPILLSEAVLDKFSLGRVETCDDSSKVPEYRPNSHLSLLAMVDCWAHLEINPFHHLDLAATPLFRLFLGVAQHLFLSPKLTDMAIRSAIHDTWHRSDDLEFVVAARGWSQCVRFGSFEVYRKRFEETRSFFESRFEEVGVLGSEMIKAVMASEMK